MRYLKINLWNVSLECLCSGTNTTYCLPPSSFWRMGFCLLFLYSRITAWNLVNVGSIIEFTLLVLFSIPMICATHFTDLFLFHHCLFYIYLTHNIWALSFISLSPSTWLISYIQQMIVFVLFIVHWLNWKIILQIPSFKIISLWLTCWTRWWSSLYHSLHFVYV